MQRSSILRLEGEFSYGVFLERPNRFLAIIAVKGEIVEVFVPNPGRLRELLLPGTKVVVRKSLSLLRKTRYDLLGVYLGGKAVIIDSRIPNKLMMEAFQNRKIKGFEEYSKIVKEPKLGDSRLDFKLISGSEEALIETKSCTLVQNQVALFPDAPTSRGTRHLEVLIAAKENGVRAAIFFIVHGERAREFVPNSHTDPVFSRKLAEAYVRGVEVYAYKLDERYPIPNIELGEKIPVLL